VCTVFEQNLTQIAGTFSSKDLASKSSFDQEGNESTMVYMGMGEQEIWDIFKRGEMGKGVSLLQFAISLVHAAVNQES
jgi:hypothetical protein